MDQHKRNHFTMDGWLWVLGFVDFDYTSRIAERHDSSWDVAEAARR